MPEAVNNAIIFAVGLGVLEFIAWHVAFGRLRDSADESQLRLRRMMFWALVPPGIVIGAVIGYLIGGDVIAGLVGRRG